MLGTQSLILGKEDAKGPRPGLVVPDESTEPVHRRLRALRKDRAKKVASCCSVTYTNVDLIYGEQQVGYQLL